MIKVGMIRKKLLKKFIIGDILMFLVGGVNKLNSKNI